MQMTTVTPEPVQTLAGANGNGNGQGAIGVRRVLVAIPCYNEELAIAGVVLRAKRYADEVLVIDDGSSDKTCEVAELAGATVMRNPGNRGKGYSVRRAFKHAQDHQFDALVLIDGDGQHDPDEIPQLIEPLTGKHRKPVDVSLGFRFGDNTEMPMWRRLGKRVLDYATSYGGGGAVTDSQCGYRAFGRKSIGVMAERLTGDGFSIESEQLVAASAAGLTTENVTIHCRYEGIDGSTKGPVEHAAGVLMSMIEMVTAKRPLLFLGLPSLALVVGAVFMGIYTLQAYNITSVFSVPLALTTATMALLGVFGVFSATILNLVASMERRLKRQVN